MSALPLLSVRTGVAETFGQAESVAEVIERLQAQAEGSPWAEACLSSMSQTPDWQLALAFAQIEVGDSPPSAVFFF